MTIHYMKSIKSALDIIPIFERQITDEEAINRAKSLDLNLKTLKGYDVPEIVSGGSLEDSLLNIVSEVQKTSGVPLKVTAGNDKWHQKRKDFSWHKKGMAIDFTLIDPSAENLTAVEKAIVDLMVSGKYDTGGYRLGGLNEYDRPTAHATAKHFHLSLTPDRQSRDGKECVFPRHGIRSYRDIRKMRKTGQSPEDIKLPLDNKSKKLKAPAEAPTAGKLFSIGSAGDMVSNIQNKLIELGYKLPIYGADGKFGNETKMAVKKFQHDNNLKVDGIVDPNTMSKLQLT